MVYSNLPAKGTTKPHFTYEQEMALEILSQPGRGGFGNYAEIAEKIGIHEKTLRRWRQTDTFQRELQRRTLQKVNENLPNIMSTLVEKAISGNNKSAELVLKSLGLMKDQHIVIPAQPEEPEFDPRSNENIEKDIEDLKRLLNEINGDTGNDHDN